MQSARWWLDKTASEARTPQKATAIAGARGIRTVRCVPAHDEAGRSFTGFYLHFVLMLLFLLSYCALQEFSGPYADFPAPTSDEEHLVPNSGGWVPWAPSDYPHPPNGYPCNPGQQPFAYSPPATSETGRLPLDATGSTGVSPIYCFPPLQHAPFPTHFGFCGSGNGANDEVLPPTHTSADVSHMETTVPLEATRSLIRANVAMQYASSEMNG